MARRPVGHCRRGRHARRAHGLLYGAVSYETHAQPDERRQRRLPPQRRHHRPPARRPGLLFDPLAVGYLPGVEPPADACRHDACERHGPLDARHVRCDGRAADLAPLVGRDAHDDRLPCRVGYRRRLDEGNPGLRCGARARRHGALVELQPQGVGVLRRRGVHPLEHPARIGLLHARIRLRRLDDRPHGRGAGPRRSGCGVLRPGAQLRQCLRRLDPLLPRAAARRQLVGALRGVRRRARLHRGHAVAVPLLRAARRERAGAALRRPRGLRAGARPPLHARIAARGCRS